LKIGYAKVNITPEQPVPLAGYGKRKGVKYKKVHDSVFVRVISLSNNKETLFFVNADLLIIPPNITSILEKLLKNTPYSLRNIHLNATHTHNGPGGWGEKLAGRLFAGPFDETMPNFYANKIYQAILDSEKNKQYAKAYYSEINDNEHIKNRLNIKDGWVDPQIRALKFITKNKDEAIIYTYGAHSTVLNSATIELSADYPGLVNDLLDNDAKIFPMFMAGAVGSQAPIEKGRNDWEEIENQGKGILGYLKNLKWNQIGNEISTEFYEIPLPNASARISKNMALRSWVFGLLFGEHPSFIKYSRVGNTLIFGMPCDFSGELMKELDDYASQRGFNLIVTSFNGCYMGYVTHDRLFDTNLYETFTMSWFGYQNGAYFSKIIKDLVDKTKKEVK
jgi:hypothetical protein